MRTPIEHPLVVTSLASTAIRDDDDVTNTIGGTEYTRPKDTSQFFVACGCSVAVATDIYPRETEATLLISRDTECPSAIASKKGCASEDHPDPDFCILKAAARDIADESLDSISIDGEAAHAEAARAAGANVLDAQGLISDRRNDNQRHVCIAARADILCMLVRSECKR